MFAVCTETNGRITKVHPEPFTDYDRAVYYAQKLGYEHCGKWSGCINHDHDDGCRIYRDDGVRMEFTVRELCPVSAE